MTTDPLKDALAHCERTDLGKIVAAEVRRLSAALAEKEEALKDMKRLMNQDSAEIRRLCAARDEARAEAEQMRGRCAKPDEISLLPELARLKARLALQSEVVEAAKHTLHYMKSPATDKNHPATAIETDRLEAALAKLGGA